MAFTVTPSAAFAQSDQTSTIGDFLTAYAKALRIELPPTASPEVVIDALRASGVKLDEKLDLSKSLTQADVVRFGNGNGLRLTTRNPQAPFTAAQINQFIMVYGVTLWPGSSNNLTDDRFGAAQSKATKTKQKQKEKHKGKHKGHQSPSEPGDDHDH